MALSPRRQIHLQLALTYDEARGHGGFELSVVKLSFYPRSVSVRRTLREHCLQLVWKDAKSFEEAGT